MGREERPITDSWLRERKAVFQPIHSRKQIKGKSNDKSEETKTGPGLRYRENDRYDRKGRVGGDENV
jgi:hypothetical protein